MAGLFAFPNPGRVSRFDATDAGTGSDDLAVDAFWGAPIGGSVSTTVGTLSLDGIVLGAGGGGSVGSSATGLTLGSTTMVAVAGMSVAATPSDTSLGSTSASSGAGSSLASTASSLALGTTVASAGIQSIIRYPAPFAFPDPGRITRRSATPSPYGHAASDAAQSGFFPRAVEELIVSTVSSTVSLGATVAVFGQGSTSLVTTVYAVPLGDDMLGETPLGTSLALGDATTVDVQFTPFVAVTLETAVGDSSLGSGALSATSGASLQADVEDLLLGGIAASLEGAVGAWDVATAPGGLALDEISSVLSAGIGSVLLSLVSNQTLGTGSLTGTSGVGLESGLSILSLGGVAQFFNAGRSELLQTAASVLLLAGLSLDADFFDPTTTHPSYTAYLDAAPFPPPATIEVRVVPGVSLDLVIRPTTASLFAYGARTRALLVRVPLAGPVVESSPRARPVFERTPRRR